jgi:DNA-directed RNA polymerase specialized sigma24 family protein
MMTSSPDTVTSPGPQAATAGQDGGPTGPAEPATVGEPAVIRRPVARVAFGIDALGRWRVETRDGHGALLHDSAATDGETPPLDLAGYPTDDPAAAVALQQALRARHPGAEVAWRPGVMDTLDENAAAAHRALAAAGADRQAARAAADHAAASLRAAVQLARDAGLGPVEIADRTGYARSTVTKLLRTGGLDGEGDGQAHGGS